MRLSPAQKQAGRLFRASSQAELDALNAGKPPDGNADPLLRVVRHHCTARRGASRGIALAESYRVSPEYWVCYCGVVALLDPGVFPHRDCDGGVLAAEAGLFCWVWKSGRCPDCELVLRSTEGLVDLAADRPPEKGRIVAGQA
jgi:hypothetical protein